MSKITLALLANLEAQTAFLASLNSNFTTIQTAFDNTYSRDGTSPNQLGTILDTNGFKIINNPKGVASTDLARMDNLTNLIGPTGLTGPQGPQGLSGNGSGDVIHTNNLSELSNFTTARTNLGLAIGTNVQAYSAGLASISTAANAAAASTFLGFTASNTATTISYTSLGLSLLQAASQATAQTALGLDISATYPIGAIANTVCAGNDSRFWNLPLNQQDANYTFVIGDRVKMVRSNTATIWAWTIPPSIWTIGDTIEVRAGLSSGGTTLTRGAGVTLTKAGSTTNANVNLATGGLATLYMEATDTWVATGAGLS